MDNFHITAAVSSIPEPEASIMFIAGGADGLSRTPPEDFGLIQRDKVVKYICL